MTTDEKYQEVVDGIALARRTVAQTSRTIRDAMDAGDDPVIFLHNLAGSLAKEAPFQTGGQGAAVYTVACFLLAESGFFDPRDQVCVCPAPEKGEYLAHCPIHRGSWAETLEIMADREIMADLGEREDEDDPIDAEDLRWAMESRHVAEDVAIAEEMFPAGVEALEAAVPYCSGYCSELPGIAVSAHDPRCSEYVPVTYCSDPDCFIAECDGDHDELRCPTTGVVRGNIATVNGKWICCDGDYPNHAEPAS